MILAKETFGIRERELAKEHMTFIPFTARTRMSGVDTATVTIRKGAAEAMKDYVQAQGGISVSYTHLDVYKRQGLRRGKIKTAGRLRN